jgi:hypothetical protein
MWLLLVLINVKEVPEDSLLVYQVRWSALERYSMEEVLIGVRVTAIAMCLQRLLVKHPLILWKLRILVMIQMVLLAIWLSLHLVLL